MADIISFNKPNKTVKEPPKNNFNIWLPLPIIIPDNFRKGDVIIKKGLKLNPYFYEDFSYEMPDLGDLKIINLKNTFEKNNLIFWCLTSRIETIINDNDIA